MQPALVVLLALASCAPPALAAAPVLAAGVAHAFHHEVVPLPNLRGPPADCESEGVWTFVADTATGKGQVAGADECDWWADWWGHTPITGPDGAEVTFALLGGCARDAEDTVACRWEFDTITSTATLRKDGAFEYVKDFGINGDGAFLRVTGRLARVG